MGRTGETLDPIEFLRFEEVLEINRRMITTYGGFFTEGDSNLANPGSLKYTLEMIQGFDFDDPYPTVVEKAAILAWRIMRRHVFHDGNKRTGIESCRLMLDLGMVHFLGELDLHSVSDYRRPVGLLTYGSPFERRYAPSILLRGCETPSAKADGWPGGLSRVLQCP